MTTIWNGMGGHHLALAVLPPAGFDARHIEWVMSLYDEPHRRYHNRSHILEMLEAAHRLEVTLSPAQALAILFHDAVYVPAAAHGVNEVMSVRLMRVGCSRMVRDVVGRAAAIIVDTIQHVARSEDAKIVLDLDLLRLAAPPVEFERYSRQLLQERRAFVPIQDDAEAWQEFCRYRRPFFEKLLARRAIFTEPAVHAALEQAARVNLRTALQLDVLEPTTSYQGIG